jgi:hypothetical protein
MYPRPSAALDRQANISWWQHVYAEAHLLHMASVSSRLFACSMLHQVIRLPFWV